ncbi:cardiolipin synthase ClsB [Sterolibacteriaceae bacterium J5B]|uniref:cardiolipin synthase ClsB n=1 Tax=Sulfuricystis multivorans TaxID=2211108 RepID=UPI000F846DDF
MDFLPGNRITLLETGAQYFPALLAAIDAAQHSIQLETYIFAADTTGRAVSTALAAAAQRGVAVRVLVDGFGARDFPDGVGREIVSAGGQVEIYRPELARLSLRRNRLRRLHRKLAVIDGRLAFVGGINIIDDEDTPGLGPRFDYALRIEGPLVAPICASMLHLWRLVDWARLGRRPPKAPLDPCGQPAAIGDVAAAFVVRDNLRHRRDIEQAYLEALTGARRDVLIANAYFLPGRRFRHALIDAARRGCHVTVLLQGQVEYALLHYATQALYGQLLDNGIRIFEYRKGFLHAKVGAIDGDWATVGSSNIDPFSLLLAREANVIIEDGRFTDLLRASLERAIREDAVEITAAEFRRRGRLARTLRWLAYGLVRLMLGVTRYGGEDYRE